MTDDSITFDWQIERPDGIAVDRSGTGLGLSLLYTFVDQFGGGVSVSDNDPTGAIFYVELPKAE